jgi:hypothetical protein
MIPRMADLPPDPDPALAGRIAALRPILGTEVVDDFLRAAAEVGRGYLPGDEDLVFGLLQRVLGRMQQGGRHYGRIFPKFDGHFNRYFDFCGPDGTIWVMRPGAGRGAVPHDPAWFRDLEAGDPERAYYEVVPGAATAIVVAFLEAWASLREPG